MFCCKKAAQLLSESLDHRLTLWQRVNLRIHLAICRFCRHFDQDLHRFDAALRVYSEKIDAGTALAHSGLSHDARQRILTAMEKESM
jgi:hypothetical protein